MKYNNPWSTDGMVKRGLICEIMRRVVTAYDEQGQVVSDRVDLPKLDKGKMRLLKDVTEYNFA
jgi:hypothetical protein